MQHGPTKRARRIALGGTLLALIVGRLEAMWADGSLNKIKRVYLDPLETEPAAHP